MTSPIAVHEPAPKKLAIEELLSIDVNAQVRKLAQAQIQDDTSLATQLLRLLVARGATSLEVVVQRKTVQIVAPGATLEVHLLHALFALADSTTPAATRHSAVVALESQHAHALLFFAGGQCRDVRLRATPHGELTLVGNGPPQWLAALSQDAAIPRTEIQWAVTRPFEPSFIERLRELCRFIRLDVRFNGQLLQPGFRGALASADLSPQVPALLAVHSRRDNGKIWLTHHGVVLGHHSWPDLPWLDAVVETDCSDPAEARNFTDRVRPQILGPARSLLLKTMEHARQLPAPVRTRLLRCALTTELSRDQMEQLAKTPLFLAHLPQKAGRVDGSGTQWISLRTMRGLARERAGGLTVTTLTPEQSPELHVRDEPIVILDASQRACLQERLGFAFAAPQMQPQSPSWFHLHAWLNAWRDRDLWWRRLKGWVSQGRARPLCATDDEMDPSLASTRHLLQSHLAPTIQVIWSRGQRAPLLRQGILYLCERHGSTKRVLNTVHNQPHLLQAAIQVLLAEQAVDVSLAVKTAE